jgi:HEAT repeat protein
MGPDAEVSPLVRALRDTDPAVNVEAAKVLGGMAPEARQQAFGELLSAAGSKDDDVSRAALETLKRPVRLGGKETDLLANALRSPVERPEVRRLAAGLLGGQPGSARHAVGDLCQVLLREKSGDEALLLLSIRALAQTGDKGEQTVRTLRGLALPGQDEKVAEPIRLAAIHVLAALDPTAVSVEEILQQRQADPSEEAKRRFEQLLDRQLGALGAGDLTRLRPLLKSNDPELVRKALGTIVRVKSVRGVVGDVVALASGPDDAVRQRALNALEAVRPAPKEAVLALKALLTARGKDLSREGRTAVAVTLTRAEPHDPELAAVVVPPLLDGIYDPGPDGRPKVRQQVTKLLAGYGQSALDAVFDYFDHRVDFRSNQSAADYREELYRLLEGLGKDHPSPDNYARVKRLQQREIAKKATNYTNMMAALNDAIDALGAAGKR